MLKIKKETLEIIKLIQEGKTLIEATTIVKDKEKEN